MRLFTTLVLLTSIMFSGSASALPFYVIDNQLSNKIFDDTNSNGVVPSGVTSEGAVGGRVIINDPNATTLYTTPLDNTLPADGRFSLEDIDSFPYFSSNDPTTVSQGIQWMDFVTTDFTVSLPALSVSFTQGAIFPNDPLVTTPGWNIIPMNDHGFVVDYYFDANNLSQHFLFGASDIPWAEASALGFDMAISPVPEPETYAMLLVGLGLIGFAIRKNRGGGMSTAMT